MSTYGQIQDRINLDYLNRSNFANETRRSIQAAVRHYERKPWWFNETATSIVTSAGQTFVAFPANYHKLELLQITIASADYKLIQRDFDWIKRANTARTRGQPTDFCIYQNRIELFPIPDAIYTLPISYLHKFPALSASTDTSDWTSAVEDLVVYHATKLMWSNVLRNTEEALKYQALEQESLKAILAENEGRMLSTIKATRF